ncbi:MAG: SDR family NAD(P)-dependent oxidoreductase, partial [Actinomycetia bacterium]|nr:SDR family NAD(P)-dependent oxidoreductase [Actinomycetes bacterium]
WPPAITAAVGGVTATVVSEVTFETQTTTITDTFFISRPSQQSEGNPATEDTAAPTWTTTPNRTLGEVRAAAPADLYPFAQITGDYNPIHRSDLLARFCGLPDRIVHGMWTSAFAQRAAIEHACGGDPQRLSGWQVSFTAPVAPGSELVATSTRSAVRGGSQQVTVTVSMHAPSRPTDEPQDSTEDEVVAVATATITPPKTAYIFPGQGIQQPGMGMDARKRSAAAREVWQSADSHTRQVLGFSILEVVQENPTTLNVAGQNYRHPDGVLHLTQFTQVAMATLAAAQVAELAEAEVLVPDAVCAGHSVGEYNALSACTNVLPLPAVLEIVFARGQAMHQLVPRSADGASDYRLGVIRPHLADLNHTEAESLVRKVAADTGELCEIVNHNLKGKQYAVAGTTAALAALSAALTATDANKPPFLLVPGIDVPFHSRALRNGVPEFRKHLEAKLPAKIDPAELVGRYIPNLYPAPFQLDRSYISAVFDVCESEQLREILANWDEAAAAPGRLARTLLVELLAWQFASPVQWIQTTEVLCDAAGLAVDEVVEVGIGAAPTLTNLFQGALALPEHTGTRPRVRNLEIHSEQILQRDQDPIAEPESATHASDETDQPDKPAPAVPHAKSSATETAHAVPDLQLDAGDAALAVVALRASVRVDQVVEDSIEQLVDGASSRRNQVLLDLGKEFGISAIDGAQDWAMPELAAELRTEVAQYRFPGSVLGPAIEAGLNTALGPLGGSRTEVARRLLDHWGVPDGWLNWVLLELALTGRSGQSKRGGTLAHLPECSTTAELVDAAVHSVAQKFGITLPEPMAASPAEDSVAMAAAAGHFEDLLADTAVGLLRDLDRLPDPPAAVDHNVELSRLALLEQEHGNDRSGFVAPIFAKERHVHFASSRFWARADLDHLAHRLMAAEATDSYQDSPHRLRVRLAQHIAVDPIAEDRAKWYRDSLARTHPLTAAAFGDLLQPQDARPRAGFPEEVAGKLGDDVKDLATLAQMNAARAGEVALVTGASPGSIGEAAVKLLLEAGATVVVTTSDSTGARANHYRDLEREYAAPSAQLHMVPANLASFTDIDALVDWLVTPTHHSNGLTTTLTKPALWPTLVLPFATAPATGDLPDAGADSELSLRLLLTGLERLIGALAERSISTNRPPFTCVLPLSPNHGTFGGDGGYGAAKAGLASIGNRWASEHERWGRATRIVL